MGGGEEEVEAIADIEDCEKAEEEEGPYGTSVFLTQLFKRFTGAMVHSENPLMPAPLATRYSSST